MPDTVGKGGSRRSFVEVPEQHKPPRPLFATMKAMPYFETRDLAIYASVIATLDGAWTLYHGVIRDRPRIVVRPYRAEAVGGVGDDTEIFIVKVSNRGRRAVTIDHAAYVSKTIRGTQGVPVDLMHQLAEPQRLDESQSLTLVHGQLGGYSHGDLPTKRWFVQDGAQRIHPLRERYRQRAEKIVFWPIRRIMDWYERRTRQP